MIKLLIALTILNFNLMAQTIKEEIYSCTDGNGEVVARVFFNPNVYCQEAQKHPATLVKESRYGATVYEGELASDENGAIFKFERLIDNLKFIMELKLPFEMGEGQLRSIYDEDVESETNLNCIMKQIHVECSN